MFVKKKKAGPKSSCLMTDLDDGDAPTLSAVYEAEDSREILEDRLSLLQLKRNKQEKENIFSANSKLHKDSNSGALYGIGSYKLDYGAMFEENRKALEDKNLSTKNPDFALPLEDPMLEEDLHNLPSIFSGNAKAAFVIDTNPADTALSASKPTYKRVEIQNELDEDFNNSKSKSQDKQSTPAADAEDEEFITQDRQKSRMDEEFRLRKLDKALEEHKETNKSSLLSPVMRNSDEILTADVQDRKIAMDVGSYTYTPIVQDFGDMEAKEFEEFENQVIRNAMKNSSHSLPQGPLSKSLKRPTDSKRSSMK